MAEETTFSQADVDRLVAEGVAAERAKYADYDTLKDKASKFDAAEDAAKTELQRAQDSAATYKAQAEKLQADIDARNAREKIAAEKKVPANLLHGSNEDDLRKEADALLAFLGAAGKPGGYPNVKDNGTPSGTPSGKTRDQFANWFNSLK